MTKGKLLSVSGWIQTRNYEAKDGTRRYVTEVIADEVDFLEWGGKKDGEGAATGSNSKPDNKDNDITPVDDSDIPFK